MSVIVFFMVRAIPGDPAQILLGQQATPEQVERLRERLGLNEDPLTQYVIFLRDALTGDLGESIVTGRPVTVELLDRFPATLELTLAALLFAVAVGIPVGVLAAVRQYSWIDRLTSVVALTGVSMPIFWLALVLVVVFTVRLDLLPFPGRLSSGVEIVRITGMVVPDAILTGNFAGLWDGVKHLILPAVALGTIPMAVVTRMTRSAMLEVMGEDYIRTAHAKGVTPWRVVFKHALRNAMLPVVTVIGLQFGLLMGGAVLTETIFSWDGIGQIALESIYRRDYPMIQGVVLYGAFFFVLVNLVVDILYAVLDPRVRY
ncbi:binding-protein-dependent transport systems inner membrane component [Rubrobacter xylanophilus DSM 9941]|uniref:Binding-protein-dependent transport systems inner membrane component n=1 Tax=Rubrobacter xylanophilus (strain DSM 9941 / JCM 11954 / NBRC 16129 / PRD-1) TaxID=266117 RepID=Q1ATC8_RUBXD|nr:binding-protein-dependent transport systems inner membrane component [Rubrobacter xylanophilus DSM 9941]